MPGLSGPPDRSATRGSPGPVDLRVPRARAGAPTPDLAHDRSPLETLLRPAPPGCPATTPLTPRAGRRTGAP